MKTSQHSKKKNVHKILLNVVIFSAPDEDNNDERKKIKMSHKKLFDFAGVTRPWEETAFRFYASQVFVMPAQNASHYNLSHRFTNIHTSTQSLEFRPSECDARNCIWFSFSSLKAIGFSNWISFQAENVPKDGKFDQKTKPACKLNVTFLLNAPKKLVRFRIN